MIDKLPNLAVMAVPGSSGSPCAVANVSGKARSVAITSLTVQIRDLDHLHRVIGGLRTIKGVRDVYRVTKREVRASG